MDRAMSSSAATVQTLLDVVEAHAETHPDDLAITIVSHGVTATKQLTYRMLVNRVHEVAHQLSEARLAGERALLVYPTMLDFAAGLLGCFRAGVVAVPVYPPSPHRSNKPLHAIVRNCSAAAVLTTAQRRDSLIEHFAELPMLPILATDEVDRTPAPAERGRPPIAADHLAFLQYTSGTTGSPKGVMVSHGNLLANLEMIKRQFGAHRTIRCGSWLPVFHDMGLIGTLLLPLYVGMHALHMSSIDFLKRPLRWLQMISSFRIGFSGGPNFAYDYCAVRILEEQKAGLDLGCWEVAFNGAEPVRADTIDRFVNAFAVCGFRREAFYPCYGMAEATLFATGPLHGELRPIIQRFDATALERGDAVATASQDLPTRTLVSCGKPDPALTVEIVDPERCVRCASGRVGEIWLAGPSVSRGYWGQSEANAEFDAHILDEQGRKVAGPFFRTGDLGLMHGAEMHVAGRRKDMVIIKGRNHYPQDIEMTVAHCHPAVQQGGVAAFAIDLDACEALGVAIEIDRRAIDDPAAMREILISVRRAVATEHEVAIGLAVLVRTGSLPRTTSGKLRRNAIRDAMATGALPSYAGLGTLPTVASLASVPDRAKSCGDDRTDRVEREPADRVERAGNGERRAHVEDEHAVLAAEARIVELGERRTPGEPEASQDAVLTLLDARTHERGGNAEPRLDEVEPREQTDRQPSVPFGDVDAPPAPLGTRMPGDAQRDEQLSEPLRAEAALGEAWRRRGQRQHPSAADDRARASRHDVIGGPVGIVERREPLAQHAPAKREELGAARPDILWSPKQPLEHCGDVITPVDSAR